MIESTTPDLKIQYSANIKSSISDCLRTNKIINFGGNVNDWAQTK